MEYTKGKWKLNYELDEVKERGYYETKENDPDWKAESNKRRLAGLARDKENGIFQGIDGPNGEAVMVYAGCGSHQMEVEKQGDRFLIEHTAVMFEWLGILWDASNSDDGEIPADIATEINNFFKERAEYGKK